MLAGGGDSQNLLQLSMYHLTVIEENLVYREQGNWGGSCTAPPQFDFRAIVNSTYPIKLKIELARDHTYSSRFRIFIFSSDFFKGFLGSILEPRASFRVSFVKKLVRIRKQPDIRANRGCKHPLSIQIMLLVCMTSIPILGTI